MISYINIHVFNASIISFISFAQLNKFQGTEKKRVCFSFFVFFKINLKKVWDLQIEYVESRIDLVGLTQRSTKWLFIQMGECS